MVLKRWILAAVTVVLGTFLSSALYAAEESGGGEGLMFGLSRFDVQPDKTALIQFKFNVIRFAG